MKPSSPSCSDSSPASNYVNGRRDQSSANIKVHHPSIVRLQNNYKLIMASIETGSETHALVFGASGVAGWAVVDQILENYPKQGTFASVTALVNRPLNIADSGWPISTPSRPQLDLVAGVDLTTGTADVFTALLKEKVKNVSKATHVFYFGKSSHLSSKFAIRQIKELIRCKQPTSLSRTLN